MISACLVVYNEEKLIERCLKSIKDLVDEIIIVHDGECSDTTLEIARRFTDKIFVREHVGIAEPHRSFTYEKAVGDWILQVDADEYFDESDVKKIRVLVERGRADAYYFNWELWDGKNPVFFKGLQKLVLFKKSKISFQGVPQTVVKVSGKTEKTDIFLRHRPIYSNTSWETAGKKRKYWLESHVRYFFPENIKIECFNDSADSWIEYTKKIRSHPVFFMVFYPLINLLGQLRNGLWSSRVGISIALQQYCYYFELYLKVWQLEKRQK